MKVPLSWLREFVDVDLPTKELAHRLTMAGLEAEAVHAVGADWERVVIVQVVDLAKHPNADNLLIAKVDRGDGASTIVTGAPNLFVGARVPLAMPGGRLPPSRPWPDGLALEPRRFRGIVSEGMLCAGDELHISDDHSGIYILEDEAPVGQQLRDYLDEAVLDLYITPNRPDCMSVVGVAREIHALTGAPLRPLRWELPRGDRPASDFTSVEIRDSDLCPRFTAMVVRDVTVRPSPRWMQRRLFFSGVRPISNVVDVTNYVMLELGKPLHAYDGEKLQGGIVVRRARPGERLTTLDGQQRILDENVLVIADQERAIGVGGVMGGGDTEVDDESRLVVLESAAFDTVGIRRASRQLGLATEASRRFERGIDPESTVPSDARAAQLIAELAGARPAAGMVDAYPRPEQPRQISLRLSDVERLLGKRYEAAEVVSTLQRLDFDVHLEGETFAVTVPGHRRDVERKADLIEEVARIVGYDAIPEVIFEGEMPEPKTDPRRRLEQRARLALTAAGCQEVITYSLVSPSQPAKLDVNAPWPPPEHQDASASPLARVTNPLSVEHSALRQTLLGSLLEVVWSNLRHRERVWVFELARVYLPPFDPLPRETYRLAIALAGDREPRGWRGQAEAVDFFDLKGVVEHLLSDVQVAGVGFQPTSHQTLQPGQAAELRVGPGDSPAVGIMGRLHPRVAERFDLEGRSVLLAELDFDALGEAASETLDATSMPSSFPGLKLDLALIVDQAAAQEQVLAVLRDAGGELLESAELFDVYQGAPIPEGQKSLAYTLTFRAPDRTLTDESVAPLIETIELRLAERLGARVRRA